ncbi:MAG: response regulator [Acidobacteriia bacterium]|nr:response regulator [Terriglobia bacterium]
MIEDSKADALLMRTILSGSSMPIEVTIVEDGESATSMLRNPEFEPDLIVTDLNLPGSSGDHFLIRYQRGDTPVVVFSSSKSPTDAARALELGASEFVEKPVTLDAFAEALWAVIRKWTAGRHGTRKGVLERR